MASTATAFGAPQAAHPALWRVRSGASTVYLFGSLHLLPKALAWRSPEVAAAIASSDTFVFEIPEDASSLNEIQALVAREGSLPRDESLRALLPPPSQADYDAALALAHLPPGALDGKRPWLASLVLDVAVMKLADPTVDLGPDFILAREAATAHKALRYLETVEQQMRLIVPADRHAELEEFEADLKDLRREKSDYADFVAAWSNADTGKLDDLLNGEFAEFPEARKLLLDDRNRAWIKKIEAMLRERKVFFVTVGAGHLVGPSGVPALLRAQGFRVDGP